MERFISKELMNLRKSQKLTQSEFGKLLGMSRSKVSSWEIGRRDISIADAIILSDYFEISLDCLLNPEKVNTKKVVNIIKQCVKNFENMDNERLELFRAMKEILEESEAEK